jgi:hypothetical protein
MQVANYTQGGKISEEQQKDHLSSPDERQSAPSLATVEEGTSWNNGTTASGKYQWMAARKRNSTHLMPDCAQLTSARIEMLGWE